MSARTWTKSQQDAIEARGGTLLVSAAAGSGKTAVLVQRVIERITDPQNPADADRLLVVTFTKAAAAEMSSRIAAEIAKLLEADPMNVRLQRQQILLTRAHISTIHSFCSELIRENFYKLGISPDFRILDDSEMKLLRDDAVSAVLEKFYAQNDPDFYALVDAFSSGRDDGRMIQTVNTLYDFVRSHPFPSCWLREKSAMYEKDVSASRTVWGQTVLRYAADAVDYCISLTRNSLALMQEDEKISGAYADGFNADLAGLLALKDAADSGGWDAVSFQTGGFGFQRLKPLRGYSDDPLKNKLSAGRKEVQETVKKLAELFSADERECGEEIARIAPLVKKLFEVTQAFGEELDRLKKERRAADFSDLEHYALKLLVRETDGGFVPTEDAAEISARFDEVMVDEYQDTNEAQDMIFRAVSQNESNLFMVGDVKQSIYRFRQAMPQIFLRRRAQYPDYSRTKDAYPACVVLDKNFRSRRGVTETVNFVFRQLMSEQTGELDYTKSEELTAGADYPPCDEPAAQLDIIDLSSSEDDEEMITAESRHIAELIYQMTGDGTTVTDHGRQRPVVYRDICILLRSANQYAHEYARELAALGIPAWADTAGGFFTAAEVGVAVSLLRVIDNPMQDIPLLSVLMSPIYGFTADDMADIRIPSRSTALYLALVSAAQGGNERAAGFLKDMDAYRTLAATMPSDRLIQAVYDKTGYLNLVQAMPNGELRLANLRLLLEYAKKYEASGYNGLSGFIRFIDRLQKSSADLAPASTISEAANVVKIMSIHRSKGLEFPVCILAGCSRRFNRERGDVLLHPSLGLGVKLKDDAGLCRYTTMPREAVALELDRNEMSEELRVLYVAMTRAKEKLIMVTTVKDAGKTLGKLAARLTEENRIQPYVVRSVSSISDWLLLCALRHPGGARLRDLACALPGITVGSDEPWSINLVYPPKGDTAVLQPEEILPEQPDKKLEEEICAAMDYNYPFAALKGIQAKVAASDLAAREFSAQYATVSRPAFLSRTGLTPAERGTALHTYMQFADYEKARENPQGELLRLVAQGFLTEEQGQAVELARVRSFFEGSLAKRIFASENVLREYRFTVEITAGDVRPELPEELKNQPVVLQGAIDCAFEENGKLFIVDYKTDKTNHPSQLWERYRAQLALYRLAIEQCTGKKVAGCLLYSFYLNAEITN
ncbi:helicase-exonuclease AddAB subunit AddA [Caproiciproducens faecalis]|uniref:DNA 3'-5' helicase n=1 Tax=Caproiciproducens faecalis TaxID=2820301 RepID=A0ABS7DQJ2_9FIRM|nr:helicase-exonuclease AddAB subunit AddA [Caproiciproducens faecalis]MBW7573562.1 helicase-exonuclease AddAB subunit AddA [Caproiciproducens faecalis]